MQSKIRRALLTPDPSGNKLPVVTDYLTCGSMKELFMAKKINSSQLGRREREILDIVFRLEEASVGNVMEQMADPPAYDSVRTMLRLLERKGFVMHRIDGTKYVYRATQSRTTASKSALSHLMATFFENSVADTIAAALDLKSDDLSDDELAKLQMLIDKARREGR